MVLSGPTAAAAITLAFIGLYVVINVNYLALHSLALLELFRASENPETQPTDTARPGIAIVVPAHNEAETILDSLPSFLQLDYPNTEVIVVNDGSTDGTLDRLVEAYDLEPTGERPDDVPCEPITAVYASRTHDDLRVVDKANGGKSDALNAGIRLTEKPLFCAVDSDTIIERGALYRVSEPFYDRPQAVAAAGGTVRVANGCEFEDGRVVDVTLSRKPLVSLQAMEYLRAFYLGRFGLSRLKSLVLISGAFGVFRTETVRAIDGYRRDTVTEDFDLVIRLHEHLAELDEPYRVEYVPDATAWTEVPESLRVLSRQRRRWFRGMVETLWTHRRMVGRRSYGAVGLYALPFYVLAELLGPLIEGTGYVVLPVLFVLGWLDLPLLVLFVAVTSGFGTLLSWYAVVGESLTDEGYTRVADFGRLLRDGLLENLGYRQWKTTVAWRGFLEHLRGDTDWGVMERRGLE